MSKDFTPAEQYVADKAIKQMTGKALRDCDIILKMEGQEEIPLTNAKAKELYPELSFLYGDFKSLYERYENDRSAEKVFRQLEDALVDAEQRFEEARGENSAAEKLYKLDDKEMADEPVAKVVREWFFGRLDDSFYYSEVNNDRLLGYIESRIERDRELAKSKKKEEVSR